MTISFVHPRQQIADGNGEPYAGAKLYFYNPGTTTQRDVYQDADKTSPHSQPVVADAAGRFAAVYLPDGTYKVRCEDANGSLIYEQDNVDPGVSTGPTALPVASGGTGATNATSARSNLGAASASDLTAVQNTASVFEAKVSPSYVGGTRLGYLAGKDKALRSDLDTSNFTNVVVKQSITEAIGSVTLSSTIPADATIPQSGEGTEVFSNTFTPLFSDSYIVVSFSAQGGASATWLSASLFSGLTDADATTSTFVSSSTELNQINISKKYASWGTSSKTFSVRAGASSGTAYLNRNQSGSITLGGTMISSLTITEYK